MKQLIKIRKQWLINPSTKIESDKKLKQKFHQQNKQDLRKYLGNAKNMSLEELEEFDLDDEQR